MSCIEKITEKIEKKKHQKKANYSISSSKSLFALPMSFQISLSILVVFNSKDIAFNV